MKDQAMRVMEAGAVRAVLEGETRVLEVLAIPYGSANRRDRLNQWFTPETDLMIRVGETRPLLFMHGYSPQKRMMAKPPILGVAEVSRVDHRGLWMTAQLNDTELATRVWDAAKRQEAKASTGSLNYLVRPEPRGDGTYPPGPVEVWPVAELSVFDGGPNRVPVSDDAIVLPIRAIFDELHIDFPEAFEADEDKDAESEQPSPQPVAVRSYGGITVDPQIQEAVDAALTKRDATAAVEAEKERLIREDERNKMAGQPQHRAIFNVNTLTPGLKPAALQRSAFRITPEDEKAGLTIADAQASWEFVYAMRMAGIQKNPGVFAGLQKGADGAYRVLEETEALEGGPMVPAQLLNRIWEKRGTYSIVRKSGMSTLVSDVLTFNIPTETSAMAIAPTIAEEGAYVANEPAFVTTALTMLKKGSMVTVTEEMLEDQNLFQSYFVRAAGKAIGLAENKVLYDAINTVAGVGIGVAGAPTVAEFDAKYFVLGQEYRPEAVWIANDVTFGYIRGLLVATPRAYGSYPDLVPGELETFQGKPIFANSNWPTLAAAGAGDMFMSWLNLSEGIAWVDHSSGLRVFVDPYGDSANGRVRYFPRARFAAAVVNSDGIKNMDDA